MILPAGGLDGADPSPSAEALRIAVVSDGSGYQPSPRAARPFDEVLDEDANLVAELGQVPTMPAVVKVSTGAELADRVQQLPDDVAAAFLTRVDPARARTAQHGPSPTPSLRQNRSSGVC
jgi:hypothetical protein